MMKTKLMTNLTALVTGALTLGQVPALMLGADPAFAGEKLSMTKAGAEVISFDAPTDQNEVFNVLRKLVKQDADNKSTRIINVISGTHGAANGTVTGACKEIQFKKEDLDSAKITSKNINIRDYHMTAPNRWKELSGQGKNVVHVLAWCYSFQWTTKNSADGNNGKLVMK